MEPITIMHARNCIDAMRSALHKDKDLFDDRKIWRANILLNALLALLSDEPDGARAAAAACAAMHFDTTRNFEKS